jgi:RHS repeat-associated protein
MTTTTPWKMYPTPFHRLGYIDNLIRRDRYYNPADPTGRAFVPTEQLWVQQDANHNVTSLANNTGAVLQRFVYDPYGKFATLDNSWAQTTDSYEWKYTHQGLRTYSDVGLIDNRERYYRPTLQRFVQQDPAQYADGSNLYQYESSRPVLNTDALGLQAQPPTTSPAGPVKPPIFSGYKDDRFQSHDDLIARLVDDFQQEQAEILRVQRPAGGQGRRS